MQDQSENEIPLEREVSPSEEEVVSLEPARKPPASKRGDGGMPRKRKPPIVNRRGPSEVDRALQMSRASNPRAASSTRKPAEGALSRGTVIRIDRAKGFGFLVDAAGEHRFFHRSAVLDNGFADLREQQPVDFEAHGDERGAKALKVRPAGTAPPSRIPQRSEPSSKLPKTAAWHSDLSPFRSGSGAPTRGRKYSI